MDIDMKMKAVADSNETRYMSQPRLAMIRGAVLALEHCTAGDPMGWPASRIKGMATYIVDEALGMDPEICLVCGGEHGRGMPCPKMRPVS